MAASKAACRCGPGSPAVRGLDGELGAQCHGADASRRCRRRVERTRPRWRRTWVMDAVILDPELAPLLEGAPPLELTPELLVEIRSTSRRMLSGGRGGAPRRRRAPRPRRARRPGGPGAGAPTGGRGGDPSGALPHPRRGLRRRLVRHGRRPLRPDLHSSSATSACPSSTAWRRRPRTPGRWRTATPGCDGPTTTPAELGIDPDRIGIGGTSAGGGLAAALALLARDRGEVPVAFQLLECPMLDDRQETSSSQLEGLPVWSRESNEFGWRSYLGELYGSDDVPALAAPARARDLRGLPPALVIVGGADGFRDEDVLYALRLNQAGVPTELHVLPGAPHGGAAVPGHDPGPPVGGAGHGLAPAPPRRLTARLRRTAPGPRPPGPRPARRRGPALHSAFTGAPAGVPSSSTRCAIEPRSANASRTGRSAGPVGESPCQARSTASLAAGAVSGGGAGPARRQRLEALDHRARGAPQGASGRRVGHDGEGAAQVGVDPSGELPDLLHLEHGDAERDERRRRPPGGRRRASSGSGSGPARRRGGPPGARPPRRRRPWRRARPRRGDGPPLGRTGPGRGAGRAPRRQARTPRPRPGRPRSRRAVATARSGARDQLPGSTSWNSTSTVVVMAVTDQAHRRVAAPVKRVAVMPASVASSTTRVRAPLTSARAMSPTAIPRPSTVPSRRSSDRRAEAPRVVRRVTTTVSTAQ